MGFAETGSLPANAKRAEPGCECRRSPPCVCGQDRGGQRSKSDGVRAKLATILALGAARIRGAGCRFRPDPIGFALSDSLRTPADWRKSFLIEYTSDIVFPRMLKMGYDAVRTERYKYIRYRELEGMNELYDLQEDPFELTNLMVSPAAAEMRRQMEAELGRILASGRARP